MLAEFTRLRSHTPHVMIGASKPRGPAASLGSRGSARATESQCARLLKVTAKHPRASRRGNRDLPHGGCSFIRGHLTRQPRGFVWSLGQQKTEFYEGSKRMEMLHRKPGCYVMNTTARRVNTTLEFHICDHGWRPCVLEGQVHRRLQGTRDE